MVLQRVMVMVQDFLDWLAQTAPARDPAALLVVAALAGHLARIGLGAWRAHLDASPAEAPALLTPLPSQEALDFDAIAHVALGRRPLMGPQQGRVLATVNAYLAALDQGHFAQAEMPLSTVLTLPPRARMGPSGRAARAALDSLRLDVAVFDRQGLVVAAVAIPSPRAVLGADRPLREAMRRAGVPLVKLDPGWSAERLNAALTQALGLRPRLVLVGGTEVGSMTDEADDPQAV